MKMETPFNTAIVNSVQKMVAHKRASMQPVQTVIVSHAMGLVK